MLKSLVKAIAAALASIGAPRTEEILENLKNELDGGCFALSQQERNFLIWAVQRLTFSQIPLENEAPVVVELWERLRRLGIDYEILQRGLLLFLVSGERKRNGFVLSAVRARLH